MAEDFAAQSRSPEEACLEGVAQSDACLTILGQTYGSRTESGFSATEAEYVEAERLRIPVLLFRTTHAMEEDQEELLRRIAGGWSQGNLYDRFDTPEDLQKAIVRALSDLGRGRSTRGLDRPPESLGRLLNSVNPRYEDVAVTVAWVPQSGGGPLVGLHEIETLLHELVNRVNGRLPGYSSAHAFAKERSVEVQQGEDGRASFLHIELHDDGRIVCAIGLRNERSSPLDLAASFVIEEGRLGWSLSNFLQLIGELTASIDTNGRIRQGWVQCRLKGVTQRTVSTMPTEEQHSYAVPMHGLPDPLDFPATAVQVSMKELANPTSTVAGFVGALKRRFAEALRTRY
jgi:hypothetical protein